MFYYYISELVDVIWSLFNWFSLFSDGPNVVKEEEPVSTETGMTPTAHRNYTGN